MAKKKTTKKIKNTYSKPIILPLVLFLTLFGCFVVYQMITIYKAHETFDGYCHWRGLVTVSKFRDYGFCKNPKSGAQQKMVLFNGRWFLDGDLPCGFLCF